jgi:DNA polymerase elongation subunit (family B)
MSDFNLIRPGSDCYDNSNPDIGDWVAFDFEWVTKSLKIPIIPKIGKSASDTSEPPEEYISEVYNEIVTFGCEDSYGNKGSFDISEFNSVREFLEIIKKILTEYNYCFAWGSKAIRRKNTKTSELEGIDGDLVVLDSNFKKHGIPSIIEYNEFSGIPYVKKIIAKYSILFHSDIDLLKVFAKPLVRLIFKNKYKSLHLDAVCKVLLGYGKLYEKTGEKLEEMSIKERKSYCEHDAHLVAELVRIRNGEILRIMQIIATHIGLSLEDVCHKGMSGIWKKMIDNEIRRKISLLGYDRVPLVLRNLFSNNSVSSIEYFDNFADEDEDEEGDDDLLEYRENSYDHYVEMLEQKSKRRETNSTSINDYSHSRNSNNIRKDKVLRIEKSGRKFKGGLVLDPIRGLHDDVYLMDTSSMYPTIIINYNLSPETVNCLCCKYELESAHLFDEEFLNDFIHLHEKGANKYWICKRRKGLFSRILKNLTEKRLQYKREGKELESLAMKIIINSGYGVFGYPDFKYYDPSIAEIITALGRQTLSNIIEIAEEMKFTVLYGDSDSIFCNDIKNKQEIDIFRDNCKQEINVEVNHEKTFKKLILVSKKHYVGILYDPNKEPIIKGMEAIKSDRPEFIRTTFMNLIEDFQHDTNPIPKLKDAFSAIDKRKVSAERLAISLVLSKEPQDYVNDCVQKRLGIKNNLRKGDVLVYYKCNKQEKMTVIEGKQKVRSISESDDPNDISYAKYKEMLINIIKDVVEILGYSVEKDLLTKRRLLQEP